MKKPKIKKEKTKSDVVNFNLTISDWINYLSSLINSLDNKVAHYENLKLGFITATIALTALIGGLTIPLFFKPEDTFQSLFFPVALIIGMYIAIFAIEKGLNFTSEYYIYCVEEIHVLIDKIIQGKLDNSDSIKENYNNIRKKLIEKYPDKQLI